ncbi:MAG: TMEM165/GDT1 family protein [Acidimicrobiales bacterium]|nr:TMEM165/GDT1 family protein [Acidimicrobiales bacterium]
MEAVVIAAAVVFLAELGDKTQLVAASLATRHPPLLVLGGIAVVFAITQGFAALAGGLLGAALPETAIGIGAAIIFFGFAVWTWRDIDDDDDELLGTGTGPGLRALVTIIVAMTVAEMGDKTMLATTTLAADGDPLLTWLGGTVGATASSGLGVVVGAMLGTRLPERTTKRIAAGLFAVFGLLLLVDALR